MGFHLAQCNVGRIIRPLDHDEMADFVAALDPINALAEASPGFVWRLKDDDGQSSSYVDIPGSDDPLLIINYSIWEDLDSLKHFVNKTRHVDYLRRRREWFEKLDVPTSVAWWVDAGTIPDVGEAFRRVLLLQENGPTPEAFTLSRPTPMPVP
ncbi:MAG TPA: DUF3291 domain-containing protein [Acidimicrobiia bacterium]